jgi:hypothetical protein
MKETRNYLQPVIKSILSPTAACIRALTVMCAEDR